MMDRRRMRKPKTHDVIMILAFAMTGLLERKVIPEGPWREICFVLLGTLQFASVKLAQRWIPGGKGAVPMLHAPSTPVPPIPPPEEPNK